MYPTRKLSELASIKNGKSNADEAIDNWAYAFFDRSKKIKRSSRFLFDCEALIIPWEWAEFLPRYYSWKFDLHQRAYAIHDFSSDINVFYLEYFLIHTKKYFEDVAVGATVKSLRMRHFEDLEIPLPPLSTQLAIVARLDSAMSEIDEARRQVESALASVREVWESTLESVFVGGGEWWEEKRLREIATFRNWMNFTKWSKWEKLKIVGVKDFQKNFWIPFENLESVIIDGKLNEIDILKKGDILAVRSNGNPALIGRTILAWPTWDNICHSGFTIRIRINRESISPVYLCHFLKTQKAKSELIESGTGINIKSLNQQALSILLIPFPPLPEQSRIVAHLDAVRAETESLERLYREKLASLDELRRSVLAEAFL